MTLRERIAALVEPLKSEETTLLEQRKELQTQLDAINTDLREVQKLLRAADPEAYTKSENGNTAKASEATVQKILAIMWREPQTTFTMQELAHRSGMTQSTVSSVMGELRARGDVRSIGRVAKNPGQTMGVAPLGFKIAEGATQATDPLQQAMLEEVGPVRSKARANVASKHVDAIYQHLLTEPDREWRRRDTYELLGVHEATTNFAWRVLEDEGMVEVLEAPHGGHPGVYKVVKNGG